jgi:hypothetical protein
VDAGWALCGWWYYASQIENGKDRMWEANQCHISHSFLKWFMESDSSTIANSLHGWGQGDMTQLDHIRFWRGIHDTAATLVM